MKKTNFIISILLVLALLAGCSTQENKQEMSETKEKVETKDDGIEKKEEKVENEEKKEEDSEALKEEEKEDNNKNNENRIIALSPPIYSILCTMNLENQVVGVNPRTFKSGNPKILEKINPDYQKIDTKFVNADFKVNKESLLNLEPSIVLLYGKFQDEGLSDLQIPVENLKIDTMSPEEITTHWEETLADIFKIENQNKIKDAWEKTHKILEENSQDRDIKAMYIFSNMKGIMVSGQNSYGDAFMKMVGIKNVAGEVEGFREGAGQVEVSMEQIHEWNPDIIFVGTGASAQDMIDGKIPNQNWENIDAVKNKRVFDIPNGVYNWGMPCSDSPLLPIWMLNIVDENAISKEEVDNYIKDFYKTSYDLELDDELLDCIYNHR